MTDKLTDPTTREIGAMNQENVHNLLESLAIYPFTQRLHMSRDDLKDLLSRARQEANDASLKPYFPM